MLDVAIPSTASKTSSTQSVTSKARPAIQVPRRQPHRSLVMTIGLAVVAVLVAALAGGTWFLRHGNGQIEATQDRDQRFVDTAKQTVVNMFSYTQNTVDESVNRFVNGIGPGPLRDMMNQSNNADNLKYLFKQTQANSEAVITAAALESIDNTSNIAKVLVTVPVNPPVVTITGTFISSFAQPRTSTKGANSIVSNPLGQKSSTFIVPPPS